MRHRLRTQVGIIGAGPAGLLLAQLLHRNGVESVVVENRSQEYVIDRVRAGVLEQGTVDLLRALGVGRGVEIRGLRHHGFYISFGGQRHHIDMNRLTGGQAITVYGQNEVVKDLIEARTATKQPLFFECGSVSIHDLETQPRITCTHGDDSVEVTCDFIAGCDGFHGISRPAIPHDWITISERTYPFAWLGILAEAAPSSEELIYTRHERGFALFSMRSPNVTRLYVQVPADESIDRWTDEAIWEELLVRMRTADGWQPTVGRIIQKSVAPMRSFVASPMQYGHLFLAGDAAHIVPPTGAKGLNLAASDVLVLAHGLKHFYQSGSREALERYSAVCLRRVWKVQRFSWWMTALLHKFPDETPFDRQRQRADLEYLTSSTAAMTSLAEQYVGLPQEVSLESVGLQVP